MYLLRLDDASDHMDVDKWLRVEQILNSYGVKPLVGVIPNVMDPELLKYPERPAFWTDTIPRWQSNGWELALHGYNHVYLTEEGGLNPVNKRSEFAGLSLNEQKEKIKNGYQILSKRGIKPRVFFAPSHTFDENTLIALKSETPIRVISDTVANDVYYEKDFFFVPQQCGLVRKLPFKLTTFCYHPNIMTEAMFTNLEKFISRNRNDFIDYKQIELKKREKNLLDQTLGKIYFKRRHK